MLIAFFGGAFNPPHMGHYLAAAYYLAVEPKGELWLMPSARHPYGKDMASFEDRLRWCRMIGRMLGPRVKVSALERKIKAEKVYTWLLVQALAKKHPHARLRMLVGADAYEDRGSWHRADELAAAIEFFPIGRGERRVGEKHMLAMPAVSSSEVRERLKRGEACDGLVPAPVLRDIMRRWAYRR